MAAFPLRKIPPLRLGAPPPLVTDFVGQRFIRLREIIRRAAHATLALLPARAYLFITLEHGTEKIATSPVALTLQLR
ncbi:hypothetical protein [Nibricoccus aquaticus]|uniref:hypothetical protein n=1 Tax=Nibricoccus aquaticus TaxID=2576891 RepID=UPI0010FE6974|nr:hypothetical protein [Nibricoccus aquaticus]